MLLALQIGAPGRRKAHVDRQAGSGNMGPQTLHQRPIILVYLKPQIEKFAAVAPGLRGAGHDDPVQQGLPVGKQRVRIILAIGCVEPEKRESVAR